MGKRAGRHFAPRSDGEPKVAHVLVIHEQDDYREWARHVLKRAGLEVIEAGDALAGMQRALEDEPDLVVVPGGLSGINGLDVVSRLANEPRTARLPVLVSSQRPVEIPEVASRRGVAQELASPSRRSTDLVRSVRDVLFEAGATWVAAREATFGVDPGTSL